MNDIVSEVTTVLLKAYNAANAAEAQLIAVKRWAASPTATMDELLAILDQEPAKSLVVDDDGKRPGW